MRVPNSYRKIVGLILHLIKLKVIIEIDIKHVYIHAGNRMWSVFAMLVRFIGTVDGEFLRYRHSSSDLKAVTDSTFLGRGILEISNMCIIRRYSIYSIIIVKSIVEIFLSSTNIGSEKIHDTTQREDANIKSFDWILQREVNIKYEFSSLKSAESTISKFIVFNNDERLPHVIDNRTQKEVLE